MNTKSLSMKVRMGAMMEIRTRDLMRPLPKLESYAYRPESVAERARKAQIKREQKQDEWQ